MIPDLRTGDLVLFRSHKLSARIAQLALRCPFSHAAVVVVLPSLPHLPFLVEADPNGVHLPVNLASEIELHTVDCRSRLGSWLRVPRNQLVVRHLTQDSPTLASGGWSQLLHLASALAREPKLSRRGSRNFGDRPSVLSMPTTGSSMSVTVKDSNEAPHARKVSHMHALLDALYGAEFVSSLAMLNSADAIASLAAAEATARAYQAIGAIDESADPASYTLKDFSDRPPVPLSHPIEVVLE